jgi:hypothetical protein
MLTGVDIEHISVTSTLIKKGVDTMADKKIQIKHKRLSKSQRKHVRRLKQEARKTGTEIKVS